MKFNFSLNNPVFVFAVILFGVVLLYFPSLSNHFALDDHYLILENRNIHFKNFDRVDTEVGIFRPISNIFRVLLYEGFGLNPFYYHLVNLVLFASVCFAVFMLLRRLTETKIAFLATLLFLLHPISAYSVNHICGHEVLIGGLFSVLSVYCFATGWQDKKHLRVYEGVFFYCVALLTQDVAILIPAVLFFLGYFHLRFSVLKSLRTLIPYFIVVGLFFAWKTLCFPKSTGNLLVHLRSANLLESFQLLGWYFVKLIWPFDIVFLMNLSGLQKTELVLYFLCGIFVCAYLVMTVFEKKSQDRLSAAWLLCGLLLVVCLSSVYYSAMGTIIEPHWLFFSNIGLFWLISRRIFDFKQLIRPLLFRILIAGVCVFFAVVTFSYSAIFYDTTTYCAYWLRRVPHNPYAYGYLANFYKQRGDDRRALENWLKLLSYGDNEQIYFNIAEAYERLESKSKLSGIVGQAADRFPRSSRFQNWQGVLYFNENNDAKAVEFFMKAIESDGRNIEAHENLANTYIRSHQFEKAVTVLERLLGLKKDRVSVKGILAKQMICFARLNQPLELEKRWESFWKLNPTVSEVEGFKNLCVLMKINELVSRIEEAAK